MWFEKNLEKYKNYVKQNPRQVKRLEEVARMGTMIFPVSKLGIYSEVINEAMYSILGNISSLHDHYIHSQNEFPKWSENLRLFLLIRLRMFLTFLSHTEVVFEMYLRQFVSQKVCRKFVIFLEWFKVFSKLVLLFAYRRSRMNPMLFSNGQYIANSDLPLIAKKKEQTSPCENRDEPVLWVGKRTGKKFILPHSLRDKSNVERATNANNEVNIQAMSNEAKANRNLSYGAEILNIFRPIVTLYSNSWKGWIISLLTDIMSYRLLFLANICKSTQRNLSVKQYMMQKLKSQNTQYNLSNVSPDLRTETIRRTVLLLLYLMRSPFYEKYTLNLAKNIQNSLKALPLASKLGNFLEDTLNYYHKAHFYISGS